MLVVTIDVETSRYARVRLEGANNELFVTLRLDATLTEARKTKGVLICSGKHLSVTIYPENVQGDFTIRLHSRKPVLRVEIGVTDKLNMPLSSGRYEFVLGAN